MNVIQTLATKYKVIVNNKAALACVDYILEHEADDYYEQATENNITKKNWENKWDKIHHVYASALKAVGMLPDLEEFED